MPSAPHSRAPAHAVALLDVHGGAAEHAATEIGAGRANLLAVQVDVTHFEAVQVAIARVVECTDALDVVVNCAGRYAGHPFPDESSETWRALIDLNLLGTIYVRHAAIPHLVKASSGCIINIASDAGRTGSAGETVYSAAKGGGIALTRSLARELARYQITVNCVSPGPTDTPMLRAFDAQAGGVFDKLISATTTVTAAAAPGHRRGGHVPRIRIGGTYHRPGPKRQRRPDHGVNFRRARPGSQGAPGAACRRPPPESPP